MNLNLLDKVALVSGSSKGIGFAIAFQLASEGARVIINGRTSQTVGAALVRIKREIPNAKIDGFIGDLSTMEDVASLVRSVPTVDILVNNLGIYEAKSFDQITDQDWRHILEVNLLSGIRLTREYLPKMKERNWGRVVFISSESGIQIPVEMIHYGTTKTAQLALSRGLAESCAGTGVTVNAILPGPTLSAGIEKFVDEHRKGRSFEEFERKFFSKARPSSLLGRFETPEEIANLVTFVCSPLASGITGTALRVDGGVVRTCF